MSHDPLCYVAKNGGNCCPWMPSCDCQCMCDWIAEIREDERMRDDDYAYVATQSYATALRDAVEAVKSEWAKSGKEIGDPPLRMQVVAAIEALGGGTDD